MLVRTTSLALLLVITAFGCADHSGGRTSTPGGGDSTPPVTKGDGTAFTPATKQNPDSPQPGNTGNTGGNNNGGNNGGGGGTPGAPVPEPATFLLVGTGLAGLAIYHRRKRRPTTTA